MYKIVPTQDLQVKTYWCADLPVAEKVASDLKCRHGFDWKIIDVPQKRVWSSSSQGLLDAALKWPRQVRAFQLNPDLEFGCSQEQLDDALSHARENILKINDKEEIFCFTASDPFWQRQYLYDSSC